MFGNGNSISPIARLNNSIKCQWINQYLHEEHTFIRLKLVKETITQSMLYLTLNVALFNGSY